MFFKSKEDKPESNWSVSQTGITNHHLQKEYEVDALFFAVNEDNTSATIWHQKRYLTTLRIDKKTLGILQMRCKRCYTFIPELKDFSFKDVNGMDWQRKGQNLVSADGITYPLISLRFKGGSTTEINVLCYGAPVCSFNFSDKVFLDEQIDIALRQTYERMSTTSPYDSVHNQKEDIAATVPQADVLLTTESVAPFEVEKRIDVITAEVAFGMNIFKDVFAAFSDIFGGRNKSISNTLRDARLVVLQELRLEAKRIGANAVIAIDLDYSEISGNGKSMLFVVASGTAVKMKR